MKLDRFIESAEMQPIFDKYFTRAMITVMEHGDKQARNSPGGDELMKRLGGVGGGLPFFAFVDDGGTMIVNSIAARDDGKKGSNIGFPDKDEEVDWFLTMLSKAAPGMTADERSLIEKGLRHAKK